MLKAHGFATRLFGTVAALATVAFARTAAAASEADIILPDFGQATFSGLGGLSGRAVLFGGMVLSALGLALSLFWLGQIRKLPVHRAMLEISELIYETCKTYLGTQIKFILLLEAFVAVVIVAYFGFVQGLGAGEVILILLFSLIGIAGSCGVALFGIRVNTYANSRSAFASLRGKPYPTYAIPLKAGMSIGMALISVELLLLLSILLFVPGELAGRSFIGFAIGASLGASALRIAGGIFTKIADIGSDLMKIVFNIKEDDARNPGVIADCAGDNAGDSVGPSADGFETYGVTAVALIAFITLALIGQLALQAQLIVWIFSLSVALLVMSVVAYFINQAITRSQSGEAERMNFEAPLTRLVWITSLLSIGMVFVVSALVLQGVGGPEGLWWQLSAIVSCGTLAGALIPEVIKVFTSTESRHVREVVGASREGGASLNILAGLTAGNFSAYWMGLVIVVLMGLAFWFSSMGLDQLFVGTMGETAAGAAGAVFAFGLVAFGFLSMGPVTVAVDSYGPVTDNAQSVYELSLIEDVPNVHEEVKRDFGFTPNFDRAKDYLEENDGAGNTFKATAKPVLIGTAVVGVTTLIFSIILSLTENLQTNLHLISIVNPFFLFGLILGGAVVYWFSGAATQAVATGAYRAVEFIKANIRLEGVTKASVEDSKRVVEICTQYAQKGMLNIFVTVFFSALAFAFVDPYLFIGYLISIAIFGLFQALFMANAGGAWDNAKKIVEVDLKEKGSALHAATVVGDTVGDPFKDTSSVALNPVIKFTTLFGLLAVPLAMGLESSTLRYGLAIVFFLVSTVFVYRSFYNMRIEGNEPVHAAETAH